MKTPAASEQNTGNLLYEKSSAIIAIASTLLLILVPLTFSTAVYRFYTLPRLAVLFTGVAIVSVMLCCFVIEPRLRKSSIDFLKQRQILFAGLYLACIIISTVFAVAPLNSFWGSFENHMGFVTHFCFFICAVGLIIGAGNSWMRLQSMLWAMLITALLVSVYAVAQFFGIEPFVQADYYLFKSASGTILRVCSTLGHADYLGNFLLYMAFVAPAFVIISSGRWRRIAFFASVLIILAIICSGTRGAWLGLVFGFLIFSFLEMKNLTQRAAKLSRIQIVAAVALGLVILLAGFGLLFANSKSNSITERAKSFVGEGFTGAGRTILWRDAVKMIPAYALTGCGAEGFRKAFLPYKSKELAQLAPQTNNESSHNSYLDAAISYGLGGLILYILIIFSTFKLLFNARRRVNSDSQRVLISGLLASFAAVILHNFFIFDQLSTGLYFYAFAAIAQIVANASNSQPAIEIKAPTSPPQQITSPLKIKLKPIWVPIAIGAVFIATVMWCCFSLLRADRQIKLAFHAADSKDFTGLMNYGEQACASIEPVNAYDFLFAQALIRYAERISAPGENQPQLSESRATALASAKLHAAKSLPHSFTPDSNYLLLAYIAWLSGKTGELKSSAEEAVRLDPYYANTRWLMAQAYISEGLYEEAAEQAELAMELNPNLLEAKSAFRKARQNSSSKEQLIKKYIARGNHAAESGDMQKAKRLLLRALQISNNTCADCHRSLALAYETNHQYDEAIAEWNQFLQQAPERATTEKVPERVKDLTRKIAESGR